MFGSVSCRRSVDVQGRHGRVAGVDGRLRSAAALSSRRSRRRNSRHPRTSLNARGPSYQACGRRIRCGCAGAMGSCRYGGIGGDGDMFSLPERVALILYAMTCTFRVRKPCPDNHWLRRNLRAWRAHGRDARQAERDLAKRLAAALRRLQDTRTGGTPDHPDGAPAIAGRSRRLGDEPPFHQSPLTGALVRQSAHTDRRGSFVASPPRPSRDRSRRSRPVTPSVSVRRPPLASPADAIAAAAA